MALCAVLACGGEAVLSHRSAAEAWELVRPAEDDVDVTVIGRFTDEYRRGRTPVPCVACNTDLKFGSLLARARAWDATAIATGHYARITRAPETGRYHLWRSRDGRKDQSDFLWPLTQAQLAAARFPVGDLDKADVRAHAELAFGDIYEVITAHNGEEVVRARLPSDRIE